MLSSKESFGSIFSKPVFSAIASPTVEYLLAETGKELMPLISYLKEWGDKRLQKKKQKTRITYNP
jgi:DNA-binding HxlR family transcriptional regulator